MKISEYLTRCFSAVAELLVKDGYVYMTSSSMRFHGKQDMIFPVR